MYARRLVGEQWGLAPDKVLWIYESVVRPALDYSCQVWAHSGAWPVWLEAELRKLQRLALLCATKAQKEHSNPSHRTYAKYITPASTPEEEGCYNNS